MFENPYASPNSCESAADADAWPTGGPFVDGRCVVVRPGHPWPAICVRTGESADATCRLTLICVGNNDGSIPQKIALPGSDLLLTAQYDVEVPVSSDWFGKQQTAQYIALRLLACGFVLLGLTLLICLAAFLVQTTSGILMGGTILTFGGSLVLLAIGSTVQEMWRPVRQIERIEQGYVWLSGASPRFLSTLERWPRPAPFWNRFLR